MAKRNLLIDRYALIGDSKERRLRISDEPEKFGNHPSLKYSYAPYGALGAQYLDPFRASGGRYWGMTKGFNKWNWREFGYIRPSSDEGDSGAQSRLENAVGFKIEVKDETVIIKDASQINNYVNWHQPQLAFGSAPRSFDDRYPPAQPNPGYVASNQANAAETVVQISRDENSWIANAEAAGLTANDNLYDLQGGTTWNFYVEGAPPTETVRPEDEVGVAWTGVLSDFNSFFYDHAHEFYTPISNKSPVLDDSAGAALKIASITPHYNFFVKSYETAIESTLFTERSLPNGYMILNSIDHYDENDAQVNKLYTKLSCMYDHSLGNSFNLPRTRDQISNLGYGDNSEGSDSPLFDKSYIEKFASVNAELVRPFFANDLNKHIGYASQIMERDFVEYSDGMGGTYEDLTDWSQVGGSQDAPEMGHQTKTNRDDILFPFDITLEFDTRVLGYDGDSRDIANLLGDIPGAHDFILYNIMLANIEGLGFSSNDSNPLATFKYSKMIYDAYYPFSAQITDLAAETQSYYGFNWVHSSNEWGTGPTAQNAGGPWTNTGNYNLKSIDLGWALNYCSVLTATTAVGTPRAERVPNPLVGQSKYGFSNRDNNLIYGGVFVGRPELATTHPATPLGQSWYLNNAFGRSVMTDLGFRELVRKLSHLTRDKRRTYAEILEGKLAYNETLAYKVCKHRVDSNGNMDLTPTQSFYFSNVAQLNKIKYVDTQVKYGQKYKYIVYAYNLVIGDSYNYKNGDNIPDTVRNEYAQDMGDIPPPITESYTGEVVDMPTPTPLPGVNIATTPISVPDPNSGGDVLIDGTLDDGDLSAGEATFTVNQFPSLKIIEAPYFEFDEVEIRDLPPVFPEVEVVPFKGVNNKIRFLLQTQDVKYAFKPESYIIDPLTDLAKYNQQRVYQQRPTGPIVFGSDDTELTFEVYRTTTPPTSYESFNGQLLESLDGVAPSGQRTVNMGYDDIIEPNQTYYYTFRCSDFHGGISIPSPVYKIQLVDDNGRIFPVVELHSLGAAQNAVTEQLKSTTKPSKKYLQIGAALAQSIVDTTGLTSNNITTDTPPPPGLLTTQAEGIWSSTGTPKQVKVRLTSKQTGKKMDLNLEFLENPVVNPKDQE